MEENLKSLLEESATDISTDNNVGVIQRRNQLLRDLKKRTDISTEEGKNDIEAINEAISFNVKKMIALTKDVVMSEPLKKSKYYFRRAIAILLFMVPFALIGYFGLWTSAKFVGSFLFFSGVIGAYLWALVWSTGKRIMRDYPEEVQDDDAQ